MRTIDADALIKQINEARCADCDEASSHGCWACQWNDAIAMVKGAPTVGGWISVKDRLPEKSGYVITFVPFQIDYKIDCMYFNDEYKAFNAHFTPATAIDGVTHWMPLPEPPKGD